MSLRVGTISSEICNRGKFVGYPITILNFEDKDSKRVKGRAVDTLVKIINKMNNLHVQLTGHEPLSQEETLSLVYELVDKNYEVEIVTNCDNNIEDYRSSRTFTYLLNVHCPSSGIEECNDYSNIRKLSSRDSLRFFIFSIEDYIFALEIIKKYPPLSPVIFSAVGSEAEEELPKWILEDKTYRVRLQ